MKLLYVLRHGESELNHARGDFHRELTNYGKIQLTALKEKIDKLSVNPELIICSTAKRTRQTCEIIVGNNDSANILFNERIYECDLMSLVDELQKVDKEVTSVLLVGHNPGLSALVSFLCGDFFLSMSPGDFVILSLEIEDWNFLTQDIAIISDILR